MFERFTHQARSAVARARDEAVAMAHPFIGTEHLLLALLADDEGPAGAVLRAAGVRAEAVRSRIRELVDDEPLGDRDAEALRAIGIDLDAVRTQVEQAFGEGALDEPGRPATRRGWLRRRAESSPARGVPFSRRAKKVLGLSVREAAALHDGHIGTAHILLGLLREGEGLAAKVLHDLGVDLPGLRRRTLDGTARAA
ncbi:Clp protease N-terminal domain-containing protein [Dactylosporangium salmoneum]|uniref:Clp protease N-terminal domain-containing protein n=1 Tax=Dactylosporangium salmoneum TaxID=53361 RepID=A0ABN3H7N0_9ACTN